MLRQEFWLHLDWSSSGCNGCNGCNWCNGYNAQLYATHTSSWKINENCLHKDKDLPSLHLQFKTTVILGPHT